MSKFGLSHGIRCWRPLMVAVWGLGMAAAVLAGAPQRNLLVSWRTVDPATAQEPPGQNWGTERASTEQSVSVLNGAQARLFVGGSVNQTVWQWAPGPGFTGVPTAAAKTTPPSTTSLGANATVPAGIQVGAQTVRIELGSGLDVRVNWPGGASPVKLTLQTQSTRLANDGTPGGGSGFDPDGQTRRSEVQSTMLVPMGQWVTVAGSTAVAPSTSGSRAHRWSSQSAGGSGQEQLQIRVTLP